MAAENPLWGQERITGELAKLSLEMSSRSFAKHTEQGYGGPPSVVWTAFLRARRGHVQASDRLRVRTATLKTLHVFVVLAHAQPGAVHVCM